YGHDLRTGAGCDHLSWTVIADVRIGQLIKIPCARLIIGRVRVMRSCDQLQPRIELIRQSVPASGITHAEHFERLPVDGRIGAVGPTHTGGINPASHVSVEQGLREIERFRRSQLAVLIENDARNGPQGLRRGPSRPAPPTTTAAALSSPCGAITTTC